MLCVLVYVRTGCGLRTVVSILRIFEEVMGETFGKVPCYNTVANWVRKLGLSVYDDDPAVGTRYAITLDESIMINKEKLLLVLGYSSEHNGKPLEHKDVTVLGMKVGASFKRDDIKKEINRITQRIGTAPDYGISDGAHNLVGGFKDANITHHLDISHTLGNCMKHVYGDDKDFKALLGELGKKRLQYQMTDKAWLLPPNTRAIARFMNLSGWVEWAKSMLECYDTLNDKMKEAYAFLLPYRELVGELSRDISAIRHVENICKNNGFCERTNALCQTYIERNVLANANSRQASLGLEMLEYFQRQSKLLRNPEEVRHISTDIIESDFGIFKAKKSPNKLYGITSLVLMLPLYPKAIDYSVSKNQDFKERLANVKLKDIALWAKENLSENRVTLRSKTLKSVS